MRPSNLDEFLGQEKVIGKGTVLRKAIEKDELFSFILWGPPGSGKTTIARIIEKKTESKFVPYSAVVSGIKELKAVMREARLQKSLSGKTSILFIDEMHRFNKAQQDAFLPYVEQGDVVLIGSTTENPSFEINAALLSRMKVYLLLPLGRREVALIVERALADEEKGLGRYPVVVTDEALSVIVEASGGDARSALNILELSFELVYEKGMEEIGIDEATVEGVLQGRVFRYDRAGEEHFNLISALHKSLRNSDTDASLYWLARMLEGGEDPLYIARRMVRFASEDVGLADPRALTIALAAKEAVHFIGLPEGELALAEAAVYLSLAPKSNSITVAYGKAKGAAKRTPAAQVPMAIRNAPTSLMKSLGYGKGYRYAHDLERGAADMACLPEELEGSVFYEPTGRGHEKKMKEWLDYWRKARRPT